MKLNKKLFMVFSPKSGSYCWSDAFCMLEKEEGGTHRQVLSLLGAFWI